MGYRVAPDSGESFSELKIRSCPVADVNRLSPVISIYNRLKQGLVSLTEIIPRPSCALIEALDIMTTNADEAHRRSIERAHHD